LTRFVVDASVALCWYFPKKKTMYTEAVFDRLAGGDEAFAPALWPLEMVNGLVVAARQKAISLVQLETFIADLKDLPVSIDFGGVGRSYSSIVRLCRKHQLSAYDAAYLDLALVEGLSIATLDKNLRIAASNAGVELLPG
jgi:predicted nucleic acid-binding protein